MVTRVGGLASGMDIDSIVEKLMSAEKAPLNKLYQQQTKYEWERDAYREINTALSTFDNFLFDNYRLSSNFYKKTVSSSNSNLVTATATSAAAGSLSIEGVSQLAKSWQGVGKQINATTSTKMSTLGVEGLTTLSIKSIQSDGTLASKATNISISATDSISDVIKRINSSGAGVSAIFENGKLSITASNTGASADGKSVEFTDTSNVLGRLGFNLDGSDGSIITTAKNAVFQVNGIATERSSNSFSLNGYTITLKSIFNTKTIVDNFKQTAETNLANATANLNQHVNDLASTYAPSFDSGGNIAEQLGDILEAKQVEKENAQVALNTARDTEITLTEEESNTAGEIYDTLSNEIKAALLSGDDSNLNEEDLAVYNKYEAYAEEINAVANATITLKNVDGDLSQITADLTKYDALKTAEDQARIAKTEAESMSGVPGETTIAPVTLTSSTDVDNMVDKIKKFVETYNGLVETINGKVRETYNRNFPPLTEEQKEEMSEDEIEKWEKKAQTGLLRNDSILTNGLYSMRKTFMDEVGGLGDAMINSLAEIGITTSSTTSDGGKLIINEDKLRTAIEKNADQVASIFTKTGTAKDASKGITEDTRGIAQRLRDELKGFIGTIEKKAGKASSTNQTYTIGKRLDEVKTRIDAWVSKLKDIESRYWKQFTAMETAINKANTQSSLFQQA